MVATINFGDLIKLGVQYSVFENDDERRAVALGRAVVEFGTPALLTCFENGATKYNCKTFAAIRISHDVEHLYSTYPLNIWVEHLEANSDVYRRRRRTALTKALGTYSLCHLLAHIKCVASFYKAQSKPELSDDIQFMIETHGADQIPKELKDHCQSPDPSIHVANSLCSSYGYVMDQPTKERREALLRAITVIGVWEVVKRLTEVAPHHMDNAAGKEAIMDDVTFCLSNLG